MSRLHNAVDDYLAIRRSLGYRLERHGRLLTDFADYLEQHGAATVTVDAALAWATLPEGQPANWCSERLTVVRGLAVWLSATDPTVEVPPANLLAWRPRRAVPHLFTAEQIDALLAASKWIPSRWRAATLRTLAGLLAVTGMRSGEALALDREDFDPRVGRVVVRSGKFGKARQLPLHVTTVEALVDYLALRDEQQRGRDTAALFISLRDGRLSHRAACTGFRQLVDTAGIVGSPGARPPRMHDLRHSFVVNTVLDAYRADADVQALLATLSTYLGHIDPSATYWYMSAAPELLALAGQRLEQAP
jgi:integrase/recombinase XerD